MDRKGKSSIKKRNLGKLIDPILFILLRRNLGKKTPLSKGVGYKNTPCQNSVTGGELYTGQISLIK